MIFRNYLGLDIVPGEMRAVTLHRKGKGSLLNGGRLAPLPPEVIRISSREPNILAPQRFVETLQDVLAPLAGREERLALSLPEGAGRVLLTDIETPFKSKAEGVDILKWQLKSSLPGEGHEVQLDYQVIERSESGRRRLVVTVMAKAVLAQYEELLTAAGYYPSVIDFHALHLYNYYRPRLDLGDDFIFVAAERGILCLQYFQGGALSFHRSREIEPNPAQIFQELNRAMVGCQEKFPGFRRAGVFLHCDWEDTAGLCEALTSLFERDILALDPHLDKLLAAGVDLPRRHSPMLVAAVGAAERLL